MESMETRLHALMRKWISQANHPMRANRPEERDLILRHVAQLRELIATERQGYPDE